MYITANTNPLEDSGSRAAVASLKSLMRGLRMVSCAVGMGFCLAAGAAYAGDVGEQGKFDKMPAGTGLRDLINGGLGISNDDDKDIEYRERSPLVVPRTINLPPPENDTATTPSNWPTDQPSPKAAEQAAKKAKSARAATTQQPGTTEVHSKSTGSGTLSPSRLSLDSSSWLNIFKSDATEIGQFKGEPNRETLTQPPAGYQIPSPDYVYGVGPDKPISPQDAKPVNPRSSVK